MIKLDNQNRLPMKSVWPQTKKAQDSLIGLGLGLVLRGDELDCCEFLTYLWGRHIHNPPLGQHM